MKRKSKVSLVACQGIKREGVGGLPNSTREKLTEMFSLLLDHFGKQDWWPAETELEMMLGAILTQNTNWKNVEKAIENLKRRDLLSLKGLQSLSNKDLAKEIRPAGYFNVKAKRVRNLIDFVADRYRGELPQLLDDHTESLRQGLLSVRGIGPETADSILLYAARRPVFVVDAYTHRILTRHGMIDEGASYHELQSLFVDHLPDDVALYKEFHALIVRTGKECCRRRPLCDRCPLEQWGTPVIS
jgi:endonuclease-3 related protein